MLGCCWMLPVCTYILYCMSLQNTVYVGKQIEKRVCGEKTCCQSAYQPTLLKRHAFQLISTTELLQQNSIFSQNLANSRANLEETKHFPEKALSEGWRWSVSSAFVTLLTLPLPAEKPWWRSDCRCFRHWTAAFLLVRGVQLSLVWFHCTPPPGRCHAPCTPHPQVLWDRPSPPPAIWQRFLFFCPMLYKQWYSGVYTA